MKKMFIVLTCAFLLVYVDSCTSKKTSETGSILTDSLSVATGQMLFSQSCTACHNFKQDGIGPQLSGVTKATSVEWIKKFIKDPQAVIESGDERAKGLFEKYHAIMPPFTGSDDELNNIISFLNTKKLLSSKDKLDPNALKNPIPEPIPMSDLVVDLKLFTQIPESNKEAPLTRITKIEIQPTSKELFIVDLRGKLYHLKGDKPEVYLDIADGNPQFMNKPGHGTGFGSFAFHPEFAKNGLLYTTHTEVPGSGKADFGYPDSIKVVTQWVLSEWKAKQPATFPFSGERRELFRVNMPSPIHGVQEITFNPLAKPGSKDYGLLYIGIGDGGSAENGYQFLCHSIEKIWGTVIRIDPLGRNASDGHYGIPEGNPFSKSDNPNVKKEIFAYGFRNPHRITWSRAGQILVSNVGHHNVESLYMIQPGSDCGWPIREGSFVIDPTQNMFNIYPLPADDKKYYVTYPAAQYDHDEGDAIAGGLEYWGGAVPELKGKFIFGDIVRGRLFYVEMKDLKAGGNAPIKEWRISIDGSIKTLRELCGSEKVDERFGRDSKGEMYITTKPDGKVYKLVGAKTMRN